MKTILVHTIDGKTEVLAICSTDEELAEHVATKTSGTEIFLDTPRDLSEPKLPPNVLSK